MFSIPLSAEQTQAAQKILHAYREHTKRLPLVSCNIEDAHKEAQQTLAEYLHGHKIMRARWRPEVDQFLFYIQHWQWQAAFSMPNFLDYAVTLFMYNKLHKFDFYNIIDVWQCLKAFKDIVFMQHEPAEIPKGYFTDLVKKVLPLEINFHITLKKHLINDRDIYTRYLYIQYQLTDQTNVYLLYSYRNALISALPFPSVNQPYLLSNISIDEIEAYCRRKIPDYLYYIRPASVGHPDIPKLKTAHEDLNTDAECTQHDFVHVLHNSKISDEIKNLVFNLMDYLRAMMQQYWSNYLWHLLDTVLLGNPVKIMTSIFQEGFTYIFDEILLALFYYKIRQPYWNAIFQRNQLPMQLSVTNQTIVDVIQAENIKHQHRYESIMQLLLRVKMSQHFNCKHLVIYSQAVTLDSAAKDYHTLSQQLAFVKITKNVISHHPELSAFRNQIFLASYLGAPIADSTSPGCHVELIDFYAPTLTMVETIDFEW